MRGNLKRKRVVDFSKGMNTLFSDTQLQDGESPYILNGELKETGALSIRNGYQIVGTEQSDFATGVKNLGHFKNISSSILLANGGTKIKYLNGTTWTDLPSLPTLSVSGNRFDYQMYKTNIYAVSQEKYLEWDGSGAVVDRTAAVAADAGVGDLIVLDGALQRIMMAGDDDNPSIVYYTATDTAYDYSTVGGGGSFPVFEDDGSRITGLLIANQSKYVLKENKVCKISYNATSDVYAPDIIDANHGAIGKEAWCQAENNVYFFDGVDVRAFGTFANYTSERSLDIAYKINPTILSDMDTDYLETVRLYYYKAEKKLFLTYASNDATSGVHDKQIVFDFNLPTENGVTPVVNGLWDLPMLSAIEIGRDLYFGEGGAGKVHIIDDTFNDNGAKINFEYHTKADTFDDINQYSLIRFIDWVFTNVSGEVKIELIGENDTDIQTIIDSFTISQSDEGGAEWDVSPWDTYIWDIGSEGEEQLSFIKPRKSVRMIMQTLKVKIYNVNVDDYFTLNEMAFMYVPKKFRRKSPQLII